MNKLNYYKLKLLSTVLLTTFFLIPTVANAEEKTSTVSTRSGSILNRLLNLFKAPENSLTTRGKVCFVSPGNLGGQTIWSDRPLFIMDGEIPQARIEIHSPATNYNYEQDEQIIWTTNIVPNTKTFAYGGEQLKPGFTYDWIFTETEREEKPISFKLMSQLEREKITSELSTLETKLQTEGATTEDIAIAKADYFVEQQLLSDALQQLHLVESPSLNLTKKIADIKQYLCESNNS